MAGYKESALSSGTCHCGAVGLYAVARHGRGKGPAFFCAVHKAEADELAAGANRIRSMRAERKYDAAVQHVADEDLIHNPTGKHQSKPGATNARKRY